jgi:hypothetical protein
MKIEPFEMERWQSIWENEVQYNLSESGVHPLPLEELIPQDALEEIQSLELGYIQTNGTHELREIISRLYPRSTKNNILVTSGSSEANFLLIWSSVEPGDEVVFMLPNYMQMWGLLRGFRAAVKPFYLRERFDWNPDLDELKELVTKRTKMIIITNPNNPTGAVLSEEARQTIISLAEWAGALIVSDEVYQGAELRDPITSSFWGMTDKLVVTNGLSKAYGLPGLRVGWMVGPEDFIQRAWPYHDYTTICLSAVSSRLAQIALANREKIFQRTRSILRTNLPLLQSWMGKQEALFHLIPPKAGAIAFTRYNLNIPSAELADKIRQEKSVLLVPGKHFLMENYLRFGYGLEKDQLMAALDLVGEVLINIKKASF